jgi:S1-C subfamily serine protease
MAAALAVVAWASPSVVASLALTAPAEAQTREERVITIPRSTGVVSGGAMWARSDARAVLGVTLSAGSSKDTAGVTVEQVEPDGPAAKAGLKAGDVITAINGISLKVAKEDAEDLALVGLAQRRLQRAMAKVKPGEAVSLQLRSGGQSRTVSVTTVSESSLAQGSDPERSLRRVMGGTVVEENRRSRIGLAISPTGSARDTLGLFVSSVVSGGPAEKAGIVEGDRIAAVNGVDVRVAREDVEDRQVGSARADRFIREVQKVEPGKAVNLRVYSGGRYREVAVTAVKASELPGSEFGVTIGDGQVRIVTPSLPRFPRGTIEPFMFNGPDVRIYRRNGEGMRELRLDRDGQGPVIMRWNPDSIRERVRETVNSRVRVIRAV